MVNVQNNSYRKNISNYFYKINNNISNHGNEG